MNNGVALDLPGRPEAQSSAGVGVVGALVGNGVVESRLRQVKMQSLCDHKTACLYVMRKSVEEKKIYLDDRCQCSCVYQEVEGAKNKTLRHTSS